MNEIELEEIKQTTKNTLLRITAKTGEILKGINADPNNIVDSMIEDLELDLANIDQSMSHILIFLNPIDNPIELKEEKLND